MGAAARGFTLEMKNKEMEIAIWSENVRSMSKEMTSAHQLQSRQQHVLGEHTLQFAFQIS